MQAVNETVVLVAVAIVAIYIIPILLGTVKQVLTNVLSALVVCYVVALFWTGTVTLSDLHSSMAKVGLVLQSFATHLTSAVKANAALSDDSWTTRLCKLFVNGF